MSDAQRPTSAVETQLLDEVEAMVSRVLGSGGDLPPSVVAAWKQVRDGDELDSATLAQVVKAHDTLALAVAPATPRSLSYLARERERGRTISWLPSLGPVRLMRQLVAASFIFLVLFIATGLTSAVGEGTGDILSESGWDLFVNLMFILSSAGLGACFAGMFKANAYITNGTYDPEYESTYVVNVVLGLIAGLLLSELIPEAFGSDGSTMTDSSGDFSFGRPLLALIGGFSARVVFSILNKLVDAVESLFRGDPSDRIATEVAAAQSKVAAQTDEERVRLSSQLVQLQQTIASGADQEALAAAVQGLLDDVLPLDTKVSLPTGTTTTGTTTTDAASTDTTTTGAASADAASTDAVSADAASADAASTGTATTDATTTPDASGAAGQAGAGPAGDDPAGGGQG